MRQADLDDSETPAEGAAARPSGTPASARVLRNRGRQTMSRLLDAGRDVVARQGHQAARIDDIVQLADLSHGTFYLYFTDKDDLLRALAEECMDEIAELATSLGPVSAGPEGFGEVRDWLQRFIDTYRRWGAVIRVFMEQRHVDRRLVRRGAGLFDQIRACLGERVAEAGAVTEHVDLAAAALLAMVERYSYIVVSRDLPVDESRMLDTLARLIHRGFFGGR